MGRGYFGQISGYHFDVWMLFPKRLVTHFRVCGVFLYILSKIERSEVQIDSKEGYLSLWCHQPHPSQSLNPQTVVEFGGQEVESG